MMKKSLTRSLLTLLFCALSVRAVRPQAGNPQAPSQAEIVERGHFQLHKFEQPIGEESYEITRDGTSLAVKMGRSTLNWVRTS